ncbi:50S ribosomal protein L21 [Chloroflexi bacterium TSY]|nr:50S ribosomal protein L21 [Chloroflexi bacterium TSY]
MYAVVRTGGKQYRVAAGDILEVEKLEGDIGQTITLEDVLLVSNGDDVMIGQPNVEDASVHAKITGQHRGKKILVFRYRPKKRIRVRKGHRQHQTRLAIESIVVKGETYVAETTNSTSNEDTAHDAEVDSRDNGIDVSASSLSAGLVDDLSDASEEIVADDSSLDDEINMDEESSVAQPERADDVNGPDSVDAVDSTELSDEEEGNIAENESSTSAGDEEEESSDIQPESTDDAESGEVHIDAADSAQSTDEAESTDQEEK